MIPSARPADLPPLPKRGYPINRLDVQLVFGKRGYWRLSTDRKRVVTHADLIRELKYALDVARKVAKSAKRKR